MIVVQWETQGPLSPCSLSLNFLTWAVPGILCTESSTQSEGKILWGVCVCKEEKGAKLQTTLGKLIEIHPQQ